MQTLDLEPDYDFRLIGISCHARDYRMAWLLNKNLGFTLERMEDLEVPHKGGMSLHSIYTSFNEDDRIHIHLIANRSEKGYLIPERAQLDYLLKIELADHLDTADLQKDLKRIQQVQLVSELEVGSLKSKDNLIF